MNKWKKISIIIPIVVVAALAILYYVGTQLPRYRFEIVSHNGTVGYESFYPETRLNYTVYANVKNVQGAPDTITIYCELTRDDLTTVTKSRIVTLDAGESEILKFFFSNSDLKGKVPTQYKIHG